MQLESALVVALLLLAVLVRIPSLDKPLLDGHGFRQTQTAYTARIFHENGINLLHSELPVFGEPWEVPFEFPLFQAAASVPMAIGMSSDMASKVTNLVFFLLTALLLYGLVRQLAGRMAALFTFTFFLFTPFTMLWSRAAMIEFLVTAACVAFLWAGINWRIHRHPAFAAAAVVAGVVAWLVKPTTALFWPLPLVLFAPDEERSEPWLNRLKHRLDPVLVVLILVPFGAGLWWTHHADSIKEANPATRWLTSKALTDWTFGPWQQRTFASNWDIIAQRVDKFLLGFSVWLIPVLVAVLWRTRHRWFYIALASTGVMTVAVFFNLYVAHDYYLSAITPQVAIVVGVAGSVLINAVRHPTAKAVGVVGMAGLLIAFMISARSYYDLMFKIPTSVSISQLPELRTNTRPDDSLLFLGFDWSPEIPYYSYRRGLMLRKTVVTPSLLPTIGVDEFNGAVIQEYDGSVAEALAYYPWIGSRSPHVYSIGTSFRSLRTPAIASTTDGTAPADATVLFQGAMVLPCDGQTLELPAPRGAAWLRFDGRPEQGIVVDANAAPIPANRVAVVPATAAVAGRLAVRCMNGGHVTLLEALDAPLPSL